MAQDIIQPAPSNDSSSDVASSAAAMPDAASVHVLYAGNLADDDFMWIVECTVEEFQKFLGSPVSWVYHLAKLPDWPLASVQPTTPAKPETGILSSTAHAHAAAQAVPVRKAAPPPVLLKSFTMRVVQREKDATSDLITIQGISRTGIVTVRASQASAVAGVRNLQGFRERDAVALSVPEDEESSPSAALTSFWDDLSYDPDNPPSYKKELAVNVHTSDDRYYAHFEVTKPGELTEAQLLAKAAAFTLAYGSDPQGFTNMLNGLDQTAMYITPSGVVSGTPITLQLTPGSPPPLLYTNPGDSGESCCNMLDGAFSVNSLTGVVDNPVVKRYGIE